MIFFIVDIVLMRVGLKWEKEYFDVKTSWLLKYVSQIPLHARHVWWVLKVCNFSVSECVFISHCSNVLPSFVKMTVKKEMIQWFIFESWQIKFSLCDICDWSNNSLNPALFFLSMCALAFTKRSSVPCRAFYLLEVVFLLLVSELVLTQMFSWGITLHL